jgi:hypothetical protein
MTFVGADIFLLLVFGFVGFCFLITWYRRLIVAAPLTTGGGSRWLVGLTPPVCLTLVWAVLRSWADPEVRSSWEYQGGFLVAWGVAMIGVNLVGSLIGLDVLEHGVERRNPAAVWAWVGLLLGATLVVAGANIGQGPTIATTLGPTILALVAMLALWLLFAASSGNTASVTVERDGPSGVRLASLLIAWGLILGRSVAGDWVSTAATWRDFLQQGLKPGFVLLGLALVIEFLERPTRRRPSPPAFQAGILPAGSFLIFALGWICYLGVP